MGSRPTFLIVSRAIFLSRSKLASSCAAKSTLAPNENAPGLTGFSLKLAGSPNRKFSSSFGLLIVRVVKGACPRLKSPYDFRSHQSAAHRAGSRRRYGYARTTRRTDQE